jgi:hypothetical protein
MFQLGMRWRREHRSHSGPRTSNLFLIGDGQPRVCMKGLYDEDELSGRAYTHATGMITNLRTA